MRYEIDIFHYIDIYKKYWKAIVFGVVAVMLVVAMLEAAKPTIYRSTLIAISSKETANVGNIEKFFGLSALTSSDDIIFSMLKSRRMREDINKHFNFKDRPRFWWTLDTYVVTGGFAVEVTGSDPEMTKEIANFAVKNVDEINKQLKITTEIGMVKVLDPALKGSPIRKTTTKKAIASALFVFLGSTLFIFFKEYFSQLRKLRK